MQRKRFDFHAMKLHQARPAGNRFTGYGPDYVTVNGKRWETSLVVLADEVFEWSVRDFESLSADSFITLARLPVEILLLGTGAKLRFPHPRLTQSITAAGIGLEVMDTQAACRTYNILLAEDRKVAAALLVSNSRQLS